MFQFIFCNLSTNFEQVRVDCTSQFLQELMFKKKKVYSVSMALFYKLWLGSVCNKKNQAVRPQSATLLVTRTPSFVRMEKLIKKLRGKMNVGANQHHKKIGTDAADAQPHQLHEDLDSDDSDSFTDDSSTISKSISTNESSNSLSGPVTDL